jgi:hypothetical protein
MQSVGSANLRSPLISMSFVKLHPLGISKPGNDRDCSGSSNSQVSYLKCNSGHSCCVVTRALRLCPRRE